MNKKNESFLDLWNLTGPSPVVSIDPSNPWTFHQALDPKVLEDCELMVEDAGPRDDMGRHGTTWDDSLARSHGAYVWLPVLPQWSPWPVFKMFQWFFGALRCTNWTPQFVRWLAGHVPKREVFGMGSVHWFGWSTRRHGAEVAPFSPMQHGGFQRHHLDVNLKAQSTMLPRPMTTFCTMWICRKWRPRGDIPVASRGYPIQYFTWYPQWKHYFEPTNWVGSCQLKATSTLCGCQSLINAYWEVEF